MSPPPKIHFRSITKYAKSSGFAEVDQSLQSLQSKRLSLSELSILIFKVDYFKEIAGL